MKENALLKVFKPAEDYIASLSVREKSQIPLTIYGNLIFLLGFSMTTVFEMIRGTYLVGALSGTALVLVISSLALVKQGKIKIGMYMDTIAIVAAIAGIVFFLHEGTNIFEIYRSVAFIVVMSIFHQLFSLNSKQVRFFSVMVIIIWIAAVATLYIPFIQISKIEAIAAMAIGSIAVIGAILAIGMIQQQNEELNGTFEKESQEAVSSFEKIRKVMNQSAEGLAIGNELNGEVQKVGDNLKSIEEVFKYLKDQSVMLKSSSDSINAKSSEVMKKINGMSTSVENQAASLSRTSESTASVSRSISEISSIADSSRQSMDGMKISIEQQLKNIKNISSEVEKVNESTSEINLFVKTVESIASKTGILAMNASIEASHAGTLGQGFSVIAKEIRTLSDETSKEADKISKKLHANDLVVKETMETAKNCVSYALSSSEDISNTINAVQKILAAIAEIDVHTKDMQAELESVVNESEVSNKMVEDSINAINSQNHDLKNISGASDELNQKVTELYNQLTEIRASIKSVHDMALINSNTTEKINNSLSEK